jgi:hypothetical protein
MQPKAFMFHWIEESMPHFLKAFSAAFILFLHLILNLLDLEPVLLLRKLLQPSIDAKLVSRDSYTTW